MNKCFGLNLAIALKFEAFGTNSHEFLSGILDIFDDLHVSGLFKNAQALGALKPNREVYIDIR